MRLYLDLETIADDDCKVLWEKFENKGGGWRAKSPIPPLDSVERVRALPAQRG